MPVYYQPVNPMDLGTLRPEEFLKATAKNQSISGRWGSQEVFANGFLAVPILFLKSYAKLNPPLSPAEAIFVLELMTYKWTKDHPFPSYKTLAERMNVTDKMVRRYAQKLEDKHYLQRLQRKSKTNEFDLTRLFHALRQIALSDQSYINLSRGSRTVRKGR
jgi:hypothetical protein